MNAGLLVACADCKHGARFATRQVVTYFHSRGWNQAWEQVARRFRCSLCGSKAIDLDIAPAALKLDKPKPQMSDRERKEIVRRLRD